MNKLLPVAFLLCQIVAIDAVALNLDFDRSMERNSVSDYLKAPPSDSPPVTGPEKDSSAVLPGEEPSAAAKAILQVRLPGGEWVTPQSESVQNDGRDGYYIYLPSSEVRWWYSCTGGPWSISNSLQIDPKFGGHMHSANIPPLAHTPQGAPVPPAPQTQNNISANTQVTFTWTGPHYGARVTQVGTFGGACANSAPITTIFDFKVRDLYPLGEGVGYIFKMEDSGSHYDILNIHELFEPKLRDLGRVWKQTCPQSAVLMYQRMSLPWGGFFDLNDNWSVPTLEHSWGTAADVSKIGINKGNRKRFIEMMCRHVSIDSEIYSEKDPSHYHVALRGVPHKDFLPELTIPLGVGETKVSCCPQDNGTPNIPQACIDLAPGFSETAPEESDCQQP